MEKVELKDAQLLRKEGSYDDGDEDVTVTFEAEGITVGPHTFTAEELQELRLAWTVCSRNERQPLERYDRINILKR